MDCLVQGEGEYPHLSGNRDRREVALLMPVYGGKDSETSAIMGYAYQSYVLREKYREIAACLEKIAVTEMYHHELLAEAVLFFGGTPYIGDNQRYWQGGYLQYTQNVDTILQNDILAEKKAVFDYKNVIRLSRNDSLKNLLERIIEDEKIHIETLRGLQNAILR